eukprot:3895360-Pyramimonas_sp.AAC.1
MEAACRDCMDWCADWALRRIHQLRRIAMEMVPQGLRILAYDLCQASRGSTSELDGTQYRRRLQAHRGSCTIAIWPAGELRGAGGDRGLR